MISSEMGRGAGSEARQDGPAEASKEQDEAVEVLREVWSASGQTSTELDDLFGTARSCKNMQAVGFDALAAEGGDLRGAWRATLEREGKLSTEQGSIRDLVLGSAEPGDR